MSGGPPPFRYDVRTLEEARDALKDARAATEWASGRIEQLHRQLAGADTREKLLRSQLAAADVKLRALAHVISGRAQVAYTPCDHGHEVVTVGRACGACYARLPAATPGSTPDMCRHGHRADACPECP